MSSLKAVLRLSTQDEFLLLAAFSKNDGENEVYMFQNWT